MPPSVSLNGRTSIAALARWLAVSLVVAVAAMLTIGTLLTLEIGDVSKRWHVYELEAATKADTLSELRGLVGVGSLTDRIHDYQVDKTESQRDLVLESLRLARANLGAYRDVGVTTPAEASALARMEGALDRIEASLPDIARSDGPDAGRDRSDLGEAAAALVTLNAELSGSSSRLTQANIEGLARLRRIMLVGGTIGAAGMLTLALAILWTARRRVVAPLGRLVAHSRRLAALDLEKPFDWPRQDELGELGRTLDFTRLTLRDLLAEKEDAARRLAHQATHDHLTGLPNRAMLIRCLGERLAPSRTGALALLFLDLDGFKMVNDTLGHSIGDKLLVEVGRRISCRLGPEEQAVRLGGDEFVVVVDGGESAARDCALRIEREFALPFAVDGMELKISTSIGIAFDDGHSANPEDLLRDADIALYRAKEGGRARTEIFDVALREAVLVRHRLQTDLERAIRTGEIFVVYQPIVRLGDGSVSGFEALVRWNHRDLGLIGPAQFIPIAEETGGILELGLHVLETAGVDLDRFRRAVPPGSEMAVNVNLSPRQLWDERHVVQILDRLSAPDFAAIKIEVTESLAMTNPEVARDILLEFKKIGTKLCIDDFGTGYSSLSYLGRFPFDILKMDKSFVAGLAADEGRPCLVRGVGNLAHDLGLEVVAEGIETADQLARLRRLGCDYGQGFFISKPLPATEALAFLMRDATRFDLAAVGGGVS